MPAGARSIAIGIARASADDEVFKDATAFTAYQRG
jgi:hypothetical protein